MSKQCRKTVGKLFVFSQLSRLSQFLRIFYNMSNSWSDYFNLENLEGSVLQILLLCISAISFIGQVVLTNKFKTWRTTTTTADRGHVPPMSVTSSSSSSWWCSPALPVLYFLGSPCLVSYHSIRHVRSSSTICDAPPPIASHLLPWSVEETREVLHLDESIRQNDKEGKPTNGNACEHTQTLTYLLTRVLYGVPVFLRVGLWRWDVLRDLLLNYQSKFRWHSNHARLMGFGIP